MKQILKKIWAKIVFEWKYPYGYCEEHKERQDRWMGCGICWSESSRRMRLKEREEKIEIIKEAIIRARNQSHTHQQEEK